MPYFSSNNLRLPFRTTKAYLSYREKHYILLKNDAVPYIINNYVTANKHAIQGEERQAMPTVSIIVPAYNAEKCLPAAVSCVLAQEFADWELILVDDGSTDSTPELCDKYASDDNRIRVIHKPNAGVSEARNDGIASASGDWIAFLDADDLYEPDYLSSMISAVEDSGADSAACGFFFVYPDGSNLPAPSPLADGFHASSDVTANFVVPLLADRVSADLTLGTIWRCLFRRNDLIENNLRFSGAYLEDELFLIEYFAQEKSLCCVDRPLYRYFQNPASVTHRYLADYVETFSRTLDSKANLAERFSLPVPETWRYNSAWAGLLIAVANIFAPGAPGGLFFRSKELKRLCSLPVFASACREYIPTNMNRNKALVASLLRKKLYLTLSTLYTIKNRKR